MAKYNISDIKVAPIWELSKSETYPTGYKIKLLVRDEVQEFDTVKKVYDLQFSEKYFPYPCLGEINFFPEFDSNGVITAMHDMDEEGEYLTISSRMTVGTYAMFQKQITETTPRVCDILHIERDEVVYHGVDEVRAAGELAHELNTGFVPELHDGLRLKLAPDTVVYTWDWGSAAQPFARCTPQEAEERRYVRHFSIGELSSVMQNCYWINFYCTRGGDCFDMVKVFLNKAPGWE